MIQESRLQGNILTVPWTPFSNLLSLTQVYKMAMLSAMLGGCVFSFFLETLSEGFIEKGPITDAWCHFKSFGVWF